MSLPQVSILMTAYNREKFIGEAIESVLASSYEDFELIITDNCSSDNTVEISQSYAKHDARIRVYKNSENIGQFPNRNYAASLARTEYLKYIDSDDKIYPFGLAILMKRAKEFPEAGLIISTPVLNEVTPYPELVDSRTIYREYFLEHTLPSVSPTYMLIKKKAFDAINGFTIPAYAGTDTEFLLRVAALFPVVKAEPGVIWYRIHPEQEIQTAFRNNEYQMYDFRMLAGLLHDKNCPLSAEEKSEAYERLTKGNIRLALKLAMKSKLKLAKTLYNDINPSFWQTLKALKGRTN